MAIEKPPFSLKNSESLAVSEGPLVKPVNLSSVFSSSLQGNQASEEFIKKFILHEIYSPLTDILMFIQHQDAHQNAHIYQYLSQQIKNLLVTLSGLTQQQELGDRKTYWVDPDGLICDLIKNITALAREKRLQLSYTSNLPPHAKIEINLQALQVLTRNLLSNAVKYTPSGDIKIHLEKEPDGLTLTIHDSGVGIPEGYKNYLKNPQARSKLPSGNHGMGLILVHNSLQQLNAKIQILTKNDLDAFLKNEQQKASEDKIKYHDPAIENDRLNNPSDASANQKNLSDNGTCFQVGIPGRWQLKEEQIFFPPMSADLTQILAEDSNLYEKLLQLNLYHQPSAATIDLELKHHPIPRLECTCLSNGRKSLLNWPCSYKDLIAFFKDIDRQQKYDKNRDKSQLKTKRMAERMVLIIDDSKALQMFYAKAFETLGWMAESALDAKSANHKLKRVHYDLIIRDAILPGGKVQPTDIPAIATSTVTEFADTLRQISGLWLGTLTKPFNPEQLSDLLGLWKKHSGLPAWDVQFAYQRTSSEIALDLTKEVLDDLLNSWKALQSSITRRNLTQASDLMHRIIGGLHYTGLRLLTEHFDQLYQNILSRQQLPNAQDLNQIKRVIRQSLLLINHAIQQRESS